MSITLDGAMYKAYFLNRYLKALRLAEEASTQRERSLYLQTCRYYKDLIDFSSIRH